MKCAFLLAAGVVWASLMFSAQADVPSPTVHVHPAGGLYGTDVAHAGSPSQTHVSVPPSPASAPATLPAGEWKNEPVCKVGGAQTCSEFETCEDGSTMLRVWYLTAKGEILDRHFQCGPLKPLPGATSTTPAVDPKSAFDSVPLPESVLHFQPAGNQTLVHFKSNYYTEAAPFEKTLQFFDNTVTVDFKIRPVEFDWVFGDGTTLKTTSPGAAYPNLLVTHEYQKTGKVIASVTTVWGADYRVDGGDWAPVNGQVTKTGAGVEITVREATPVLTD